MPPYYSLFTSAHSCYLTEAQTTAHAQSQSIAHLQQQAQQARRKTPSPTHAPPRSLYGHQRRDSDTLRNATPAIPHIPSTSNLNGNNRDYQREDSPTEAVGPGAGIIPSRLSPSARGLATSQATKHKRSPTAPEMGMMGKMWGFGDDGNNNNMAEDGNGLAVQAQVHRTPTVTNTNIQSQPSTATRIKLANANAQRNAGSGHPPERNSGGGRDGGPAGGPNVRNLVVNKRIYARLDLVGKGGSSRVYRVMNAANEIYAIKRVNLDRSDQETMQGYMNEIALLKRLEGNERIIRLMDSEVKWANSDTKGHLMLVMECGEIGRSSGFFIFTFFW